MLFAAATDIFRVAEERAEKERGGRVEKRG